MDVKESENFVTPDKIVQKMSEKIMPHKANYGIIKTFVLAMAAGAMIAFGAQASFVAGTGTDSIAWGLSKLIGGFVFSTGLMMIVLTGAELFTGNVLICFSVFEKKTTISKLLRNWGVVYLGNFIGAATVATLIYFSGVFHGADEALGILALKTAYAKVNIEPLAAITSGILCNWLVCLAVWMATCAKDVAGKILAVLFPITVFVISGYEHCVANMFIITNGLLIKHSYSLIHASSFTDEQLALLNMKSFLIGNLLPVTVGNILGSFLFVVCIFWIAYIKRQ